MKRYLLDTSLLAAYLQSRKTAIDLITPWIKRHEVATSILVYAEVIEYIKGLPNYPARAYDLRRLMREIRE